MLNELLPSPADPQGPPAVTSGVVNTGAQQEQVVRHIPHTRVGHALQLNITGTDYSAPLAGAVGVLNPTEPVNYVVISPSARGNPVHVLPGNGTMRWVARNGLYYPWSDAVANLNTGPVRVILPCRQNWSIAYAVFPALAMLPLEDAIVIAIGYDPMLGDVE